MTRSSAASGRSGGFTLIEGVIASGIIATSLVVAVTLAVSNLSAAQANSDRILAGQLAREGIEVVRNIRDSNWLRREVNVDKDGATVGTQLQAWDDFFHGWPNLDQSDPACGSNCYGNYFDVIMLDPDLGFTQYNYTLRKVTSNPPDVIGCLAGPLQPSCRIHRRDDVYYQSNTPGDSPTVFYRRIHLKPICWNSVAETEIVEDDANTVCETHEKVGMLVTSRVVWQRSGKLLDVQLKERLYNWRNP